MANVTSLSTDGVPEGLKAGYWSDSLKRLFEGLDVDPIGRTSVYGYMDYFTLSRLRLFRVKGSGARVTMPFQSRGGEPTIRILFQNEGVSLFEQDGRKVELKAGDCLAHNMSRPHTLTSIGACKADMAIIPTDLAQKRGLINGIDAPRKAPLDCTAHIARNLLESIWREARDLTPDAATAVADSLLDLLLPSFAREGNQPLRMMSTYAPLGRAKRFIDANLHDPDLDIDRVARAARCTKRYLQILFCGEGTTVSRYIWRSRIERCRQELENTPSGERSITDIAFSWGFSSSSHFSRVFKDQFGFSPSALRRVVSVV